MRKYKKITVGGTFDHFHLGHQALLARAFESADMVFLGITTDAFTHNGLAKTDPYTHLIEPYAIRAAVIRTYLKKHGWDSHGQIIAIDDRFGTTLQDQSLEAIVVSPETEKVAFEINQLRQAKGWLALKVVKVPWVLAKDGQPIHSVRIRAGEIDENGVVFSLPKNWAVRTISSELRKTLARPLGTLIKDISHDFETAVLEFRTKFLHKNQFLVSVGDAVTDSLLKIGIVPHVSIIDLSIGRKKVYESAAELGFRDIKVLKMIKNKPGQLSFDNFKTVSELIHNEANGSVVQVDGEEDLLTLFAILSAPLKSLVVYGQPQEGIVVVEVTIKKKHEVLSYLAKFLPL